jgi:hypothetical protein
VIEDRTLNMTNKRQYAEDLAEEYSQLIRPHLDLAKKAYGARDQDTPAHHASRQYTELLVRYYGSGGSLERLANKLGVTYAGLRRRVVTSDVRIPPAARRRDLSDEEIQAAVLRVKSAKARGHEQYHEALAKEREAGVPLTRIARGLGMTNTAAMHYGISRYYAKKAAI